jgi:hypothetical protein
MADVMSCEKQTETALIDVIRLCPVFRSVRGSITLLLQFVFYRVPTGVANRLNRHFGGAIPNSTKSLAAIVPVRPRPPLQ